MRRPIKSSIGLVLSVTGNIPKNLHSSIATKEHLHGTYDVMITDTCSIGHKLLNYNGKWTVLEWSVL
jgi:hypothetical protein